MSWLELSFDISKYLYAPSNLTWAFIDVHKTKSHRIHYHNEYILNLKSEKLVLEIFLRPKSRC